MPVKVGDAIDALVPSELVTVEAKEASDFLDVLVNEIDGFYKDHSEILSTNGKRPHARSRLPETKQWISNIERFYELNPRRRPRK